MHARHGIRPELADLAVPIDTLAPHPDNPNDGDVEAVAESLSVHGQYRPVVVWERPEGQPLVLAGNTTYAAALSLGWTHLARTVVRADTETQAVAIMLADNRLARLARMNTAQELALLQALPNLVGTGYTPAALDDLLAAAEAAATAAIDGLPPADYAETPEQEAARVASRAGGTVGQRGLREVLLLLSATDHDELMGHLTTLRTRYGDQPQGSLVLRATRVAAALLTDTAGHRPGCDCQPCTVLLAAGATP